MTLYSVSAYQPAPPTMVDYSSIFNIKKTPDIKELPDLKLNEVFKDLHTNDLIYYNNKIQSLVREYNTNPFASTHTLQEIQSVIADVQARRNSYATTKMLEEKTPSSAIATGMSATGGGLPSFMVEVKDEKGQIKGYTWLNFAQAIISDQKDFNILDVGGAVAAFHNSPLLMGQQEKFNTQIKDSKTMEDFTKYIQEHIKSIGETTIERPIEGIFQGHIEVLRDGEGNILKDINGMPHLKYIMLTGTQKTTSNLQQRLTVATNALGSVLNSPYIGPVFNETLNTLRPVYEKFLSENNKTEINKEEGGTKVMYYALDANGQKIKVKDKDGKDTDENVLIAEEDVNTYKLQLFEKALLNKVITLLPEKLEESLKVNVNVTNINQGTRSGSDKDKDDKYELWYSAIASGIVPLNFSNGTGPVLNSPTGKLESTFLNIDPKDHGIRLTENSPILKDGEQINLDPAQAAEFRRAVTAFIADPEANRTFTVGGTTYTFEGVMADPVVTRNQQLHGLVSSFLKVSDDAAKEKLAGYYEGQLRKLKEQDNPTYKETEQNYLKTLDKKEAAAFNLLDEADKMKTLAKEIVKTEFSNLKQAATYITKSLGDLPYIRVKVKPSDKDAAGLTGGSSPANFYFQTNAPYETSGTNNRDSKHFQAQEEAKRLYKQYESMFRAALPNTIQSIPTEINWGEGNDRPISREKLK